MLLLIQIQAVTIHKCMNNSNDRMLYGKNRMWVLGNSRDKNGIYSRNLVISILMTLILDLTLEVLCAHMQNHLMCVFSCLVSTFIDNHNYCSHGVYFT